MPCCETVGVVLKTKGPATRPAAQCLAPVSRLAPTLIVGLVALLALMELSAAPAQAHPSDFATLTLDFLVGPSGLEAVDAAVVASTGTPYETFAPEVRHDVALLVLQQLGVDPDAVSIELESERYHWVGFMIRFHEPTLGRTGPLMIETSELQRRTADLGLAHLKVSVCGVTPGAERSDSRVLGELLIEATDGGRRPRGHDREACRVWQLDPGDDPAVVQAGPTALTEADGPGVGTASALAAALLLAGLLLCVGIAIHRRRLWPSSVIR